MQIPGKVENFIWRALHGILPLKSIMVNRHVGTSGQCPIYNLDAEDVLHLLFKCPTAQALWDSIGIPGIIEDALFVDRSGSAVLEFLLLKKDNDIPGFSSVGLKETIIPNLASAEAAEALALREGLCLANRLECSNVIAESDSLETSEERWWGKSAATYADCVGLRALIGNVQFKYCPMQGKLME
jgi:hypothetical protein